MIKIKEVQVASYLTKTKIPAADFVINPYVGCPHKCAYCYAEFMKRFTNHKEEWGTFLDVKVGGRPLSRKLLAGKKVSFGSVTDAYNPYEEKYRVTRRLMEQLAGMDDVEVLVLTKGALVLRDIDLFKKMKNVEIAFSLNTLDDEFRKDIEPFASSVKERLDALKELKRNGIRTGLFLSPMFPEITDFKEILKAAGGIADSFWFENLNLYPYVAKTVLKYIDAKYPRLAGLYKAIYADKSVDYWGPLEREIAEYCKARGLECRMYFYHSKIRKA